MVKSQHTMPMFGFSRGYSGAALSLGFRLGGFFDGILLHQIVQWHHLLSGVEQARLDISLLIMADGAFHAVMYAISIIGLWLLWRHRNEFVQPGADRHAVIFALLGFGIWHIIDGVLSHWVLGILPIVWAWRISKKTTECSYFLSSPVALVIATLVSAPLAALPPAGQSEVVVVFRPGVTEPQAFNAIVSAGASCES